MKLNQLNCHQSESLLILQTIYAVKNQQLVVEESEDDNKKCEINRNSKGN
jgi:hypothetical protein